LPQQAVERATRQTFKGLIPSQPQPPRPPGQAKEKPMRFEILRLDDAQGAATDRLIADAETVNELVQAAARTGERLLIRPCKTN
jgi:hypothetical protein